MQTQPSTTPRPARTGRRAASAGGPARPARPARPVSTPSSGATAGRVGVRRPGRGPRMAYVASVGLFAASLTPTVVAALEGDTATAGTSVPLVVLCALALAGFGLVSGVIGSLLLDVVLMLAVRVCGADLTLGQASRRQDRTLAPLTLGIVTASVFVLVQGTGTSFSSPVVSAVMAAAVIGHCAQHVRQLPDVLGPSVARRLAAVACYVAVPAGVIGAAQALGGGA